MATSSDVVLVVDDDVAIGKVLVALLEQRGHEAVHVPSAEEAIRALDARPYDVVLSDVRMPGMDGMGLLDHVAARFPGLPVVLITAHGSVALAVEAMKRGAADFVQKPFDREEIAFVIGKALSASHRDRAAVPAPALLSGPSFIGQSKAMQDVFATIRKVAPTNSTVLVRGETGTGKELVARALHDTSPRKSQPFVIVHCAALPENLLESELFGHEKGAFTGAVQRKLLRVIQERELERVGGTQTIRVDVRIVAATHRDLEAMVASGEFREDLFYRLAVVPLTIPPLRDRADDAARLVHHFVGEFAKTGVRKGLRIDEDAVALLAEQRWPGNVRQLQNFVERLVVLSDEDRVTRSAVEHELARSTTPGSKPVAVAPAGRDRERHDDRDLSLDTRRKETEREALVRALSQASNNRTRAARLLEVSRRTLYNKLKEHGLE